MKAARGRSPRLPRGALAAAAAAAAATASASKGEGVQGASHVRSVAEDDLEVFNLPLKADNVGTKTTSQLARSVSLMATPNQNASLLMQFLHLKCKVLKHLGI